MIAFVLCAGAAITSLGLAMATRFSRVGRAIGMTVSIYVLVTVAWAPLAAHVRPGIAKTYSREPAVLAVDGDDGSRSDISECPGYLGRFCFSGSFFMPGRAFFFTTP